VEHGRKAVLARMTGQVQGVGFRFWTRSEAEKLGLTGWVRNEADGSVTALMVGSDAAVSAMLNKSWKGPPGAMVSSVASEERIDPGEESAAFRITG
jgi:acylphosphatase